MLRRLSFIFVCALWSGHALAANLLVQTLTRTATGEVAGVALQVVAPRVSATVPGPLRFYGVTAHHAPRLIGQHALALLPLGPGPATATWPNRVSMGRILLVRAAPLALAYELPGQFADGFELVQTIVLDGDNAQREHAALLLRSEAGGPGVTGRLWILDFPSPGRNFHVDPRGPWDLPGAPVDGVALLRGQRLAILCERPGGPGTVIQLRDSSTGEVLQERVLKTNTERYGARPVALSVAARGAKLLVLTSGYDLERPLGEPASWLHVFDTDGLQESAPPLAIVGAAFLGEAPLHADADGGAWIATRSPGTDFVYATRVRLDDRSAKVIEHVPFSGVSTPLRMAMAPTGPAVAVGAGYRLEIWPQGRPGVDPVVFQGPIGDILWTPEGLFVGEAGRVHHVDPATARTLSTVQLQTGFVAAMLPFPDSARDGPDMDGDGLTPIQEQERGTATDRADTDEDGIADGLDPEPLIESPRLSLPRRVILRGDEAGEEVLTLAFDSAQAASWSVEYDRRAMPWLHVDEEHRPSGRARIQLRLDPAVYRWVKDAPLTGELKVRLSGTTAVLAAAGSPARITVEVAPARGGFRRILWARQYDPEGASRPPAASRGPLASLVDLLAGPPHHFSHRIVSGPIDGPTRDYRIVVLGIEAAAQGAMTRQVLLDYVAGGGALLLIGSHAGLSALPGLERWMEPIGIVLDPAQPVNGVFARVAGHDVSRNWDRFTVRDGCLIRVDDAVVVPVAGSGQIGTAILALRNYGFGRVAVLASGTPLENAALRRPEHRRFASDLFRWLASGRHTIQDQDADGLPDYIEDANGNGRVDPGETDYLAADTDNDGIWDGLEDTNRNGNVDEGETNPRNPDTDTDGIADGADTSPLPSAGAPRIASIGPENGPAEGGTFVEVTGLNFAADSIVWFGEQRATRVRRLDSMRIIAVSPPRLPGGTPDPVPLRVTDSRRVEAVLPGSFQYTPRSTVWLALDSLRTARRQYQTYSGVAQIRLDAFRLRIDQLVFDLQVDPPGALRGLRVDDGPGLRTANRTLAVERTGPGRFRVTVSPGRTLSGRVNLGTLRWSARPLRGQDRLKIGILLPDLRVLLGGRAKVMTAPLDIDVARPAHARGRP